MKSILARMRTIPAVVVALTVVLPAAWAEGIDDFKLTKAIPADAFLAVHCRDHAGKEFINKQYERVWAAVEKERFHVDLKRLFKALQQKQVEPGAQLEGFDEQWQQIRDLCASVEWSSLAKREFAMGMKLAFVGIPIPEFVMLMVPPEDKLKDNFEGLSGILKTVVELDPNMIKLATEEAGHTIIHRVALADSRFPVGLTLARHNDVIIIGFGFTMAEQALALLRGEGGAALASTPRFQEAFKKLPPPTDALSFVDVAKLMKQVRAMISKGTEMAEAAAPPEGEPGYEDYVKWKALPGKIIDALDLWEYEAAVKTTDGMLLTGDTVTVLRDDAKSRALYPVLYGNKPISDPLKYVPENAGEFSVTSGIDLPALYAAVVRIIREDVPRGEELIAHLEALKDEETGLGIDIEKDIVAWIGGSLISFSVPGPTPYSNPEYVFMLSVRDEAKAREMVDRLLGMVEARLGQLGGAGPQGRSAQQSGSVVDAEIEGAEGFKAVVFPMLSMLGYQPVVGVKDGWLFVGSSPGAITATVEVAAGKAENFAKNERFRKEGILPESGVTALSFTDLSKLGEQLGQLLTMVPAIQLAVPDLAKDPVMRSVLSMVGKLGRVARKLDFFQSSASRTTFDGKIEVAKKITTYREPPVITKPKPPTGTEGESEATDEESESKGPGEE
ncbi:MAG: hypothetical protein ACE5I3_04275 [Phycisphaerae bacterium]